MLEFEVDGKQYRSSKLTAFQQFHVARKLGPIFAELGPGAASVDQSGGLVAMLAPAASALAAMSEADCDYVLQRCLSVVQRHQSGSTWSNVWNEPAKRLMFEDIDMGAMVKISLQVLGDNLGNFILAPALTSSQDQPGSSSHANGSLSPTA